MISFSSSFFILILVFISLILVCILSHFHEQTNKILQRIVQGTTIEIIQTIFPCIILMFISFLFPRIGHLVWEREQVGRGNGDSER